jgi:hypothetical protein
MPPIDDAKWEDKLPLRREEMQNCLSSLLKGISLPQGEGGKGGREGLRVPLPARCTSCALIPMRGGR